MYDICQKNISVITFIIKTIIIAGAVWLIANRLQYDFKSGHIIDISILHLSGFKLLHWALLILSCTLLNWSLEVKKWQTLVSVIRPISFFQSLKQSLSSLTVSIITPNRIGEYGAKALFYPAGEQSKIVLLNFLSNFWQMASTLLFGGLSMLVLGDHLENWQVDTNNILAMFLLSLMLLIALYIFRSKLWPWFTAWKKQVINWPLTLHFNSLIYSVLRYLVFSHQFYFLLLLFQVEIDYNKAMSIIFAIYFISSVIPSFVLFDWLIKGSVAVSLFTVFGVDQMIILSTTSLMWLLNFAFPSILGSAFVLTFSRRRLDLEKSKINL